MREALVAGMAVVSVAAAAAWARRATWRDRCRRLRGTRPAVPVPARAPGYGRLLLPGRARDWWAATLADLGWAHPPEVAAGLAATVLAAAVVLGSLSGGVVLGSVAGGATAVAALLTRALLRGRQDRLLVAGLPAALDAVARTAAAGGPLASGLAEAVRLSSGRLAADLDLLVNRAELGEPLRAALDRWARVRPLPEVRLVASALVLASGSGGSIGATAQRLSTTLRQRAESRRVVVAQAAQARASATVVGLAPVAVVGAMTVADSTAAQALFGTSLGLACLVIGLAMDAVAVWWMAAMIRSAE